MPGYEVFETLDGTIVNLIYRFRGEVGEIKAKCKPLSVPAGANIHFREVSGHVQCLVI